MKNEKQESYETRGDNISKKKKKDQRGQSSKKALKKTKTRNG